MISSFPSLGVKLWFYPHQEAVADLRSQVQELRASVCEKTETIDTLKQELKDITVSSVPDAVVNVSPGHTA